MKEKILTIKDLNKTYKTFNALKNINLTLNRGEIYALIGENGAGKTTLMKIIAGLAFKTDGTITLFGKSNEKEVQKERYRIGCIVEQPALYPNMTAYHNMNICRVQKGVSDINEIKRLLTLVGLDVDNKKKVKNYSLGMKQRLSIAISLLGRPEFLILDEPTNGLDPKGVVEVRNLLVSLAKEENVTILISSHNLEKLYKVANSFIILSKGEIKENITNEELNEKCKQYISITTNDINKLIIVLKITLPALLKVFFSMLPLLMFFILLNIMLPTTTYRLLGCFISYYLLMTFSMSLSFNETLFNIFKFTPVYQMFNVESNLNNVTEVLIYVIITITLFLLIFFTTIKVFNKKELK